MTEKSSIKAANDSPPACFPSEVKPEKPSAFNPRNGFRDLPCFVKELVAGGIAGGIAKSTVAPLERVKILFQTRQRGFQSSGIFRSLILIFQKEGIPGFFRGNGASVARVVPYAALHFMTYEQYRKILIREYPEIFDSPVVDLLAGSLAGATAVVFTYPLDLIYARLAYQVGGAAEREYKGVSDVFLKTFRHGGLRELYRGSGVTLLGILPYAGLKFYVYESLKTLLIDNNISMSIPMRLTCGAISGAVGQTVTYPLDVIRRQMQVQSTNAHSSKSNPMNYVRFRSTFHGLYTVVSTQGWRQLYSGLSINYIKIVPSVSVGFTIYDLLKSWLQIPPREKSKKVSNI